MGSRPLRRFALVLAAVIAATTLVPSQADAGIWRRARSIYGPVFEDVRVCRDGIEMAIGTYWDFFPPEQTEPEPPQPALTSEPVTLFHFVPGPGSGGDEPSPNKGPIVLNVTVTNIPIVTSPSALAALAPSFPSLPPRDAVYNLRRVTLRWAGGVRLRPGTQLMGQLGFDGGSELLFADTHHPDAVSDPPLEVGRCKVFKAAKAKVDVLPGVRQNVVNPASSTPVPFALLSGRGFDARAVDPATVRIGSAVATGGTVVNVDGDNDDDFRASFVPSSAGLACGARKVVVTAMSKYGWPIQGKGKIQTTC